MDHPARDYLHLALTPGIGGVTFRNLLEHFGSPQAVLGASAATLEEIPGIGRKRAESIARGLADLGPDVDRELARAAEKNLRIISFADPEFPVGLKYLADPPPVLYVRGRLVPQDAQGFAIVGSRRCSLYGQDQAQRFGAALSGAGFTIVSGLARGIDFHAHMGALKSGGRTIAVLGNGLSAIYPPEHAAVADQIAEHGAVVSEFPVDTGPTAENFPRRNRLISGLSLGVLVIEAGLRSGATITTTYAAEQGKDVFAVPGRIDSPFSQGSNHLIQTGAKLVMCVEDILEEFPTLGLSPAQAAEQGTLPLGPQLDPQEEAIMATLDGEAITSDEIARLTGLPISAVTANLTMLELRRLVRSLPGPRYARRNTAQ